MATVSTSDLYLALDKLLAAVRACDRRGVGELAAPFQEQMGHAIAKFRRGLNLLTSGDFVAGCGPMCEAWDQIVGVNEGLWRGYLDGIFVPSGTSRE